MQKNNITIWKCSTLPLFQLYSFLANISPLGLNGPFSEKAPTPKEEQPGPAKKIKQRNLSKSNSIILLNYGKEHYEREACGPPLSQRTRGLEAGSISASAK